VKSSHHVPLRPARGKIDADSMNYSISRLSGYYGSNKVIKRQNC
jgi:hypothetical protein